jgi:peptidoglycan hydrolase-like protein with peptidoglycan-binding domain
MTMSTILKKDDTGSAVATMQTMLIACGFSCGPDGADGDFGKNTLAGLTAFQTANGLEASGIYDGDTAAALEKAYAARPAPVVTACDVSKVLAVAVAEIGYKEKASNSQLDDKTANAGSANYTKYARDFDKKYPNWYNGKKNGFAWCDRDKIGEPLRP